MLMEELQRVALTRISEQIKQNPFLFDDVNCILVGNPHDVNFFQIQYTRCSNYRVEPESFIPVLIKPIASPNIISEQLKRPD